MIFITSNSAKFSQAQRRLSHAGISLTQFYMELPESQPATGFQVASVHSIVDPVAISLTSSYLKYIALLELIP